jgi:hypothetical protein
VGTIGEVLVARRTFDIALALAVCLAVWVAPAGADTPSRQATDPSANSPAGAVYSIPLDSSRQDAEPHFHSHGGSGGPGTAGGGPTGGSGGGATSGGTAGGGTTGGGTTGGGTTVHATGGRAAAGGGATGGGSRGGARAGGRGGRGGARAGTTNDPVLVPGGEPGSLVHSENGFGSSSQVPGLNASSSAGLAAVQSNGSGAPLLAIVLAAVVLAAGAYLGTRGRRPRRGRPGPPSSS